MNDSDNYSEYNIMQNYAILFVDFGLHTLPDIQMWYPGVTHYQ